MSYQKNRTIGRRTDDFQIRTRLEQHRLLLDVGQVITSEMTLKRLFNVIIRKTNQIMDTQRSTVFLHDEKNDQLWSMVATGMKTNEIRISSDHGIAGWVFKNRAPLIINDPQNDPRFFAEIDKKSGFSTQNILCAPLTHRDGRCIGVIQILNKKQGRFSSEDVSLLQSISNYVAIALENARLYEEIKSYSGRLKSTLRRIETLEKVRTQLRKFVPGSVATMIDQDPNQLAGRKQPMQVTVLFIDVQQFSTITEKYDQTLINDMIERHFSSYLDCIERHGGEVNETSGDGLMVIFKNGTLVEHAKHAVLAGLEIVAENERLNTRKPYPWGRVALHMGINTGEALVGATKIKSVTGERWTYTASGHVTVSAAHIGQLSTDTRLFVGPGTFRHLTDHFIVAEMGEKQLKNLAKKTPIYWLKGVAEEG